MRFVPNDSGLSPTDNPVTMPGPTTIITEYDDYFISESLLRDGRQHLCSLKEKKHQQN